MVLLHDAMNGGEPQSGALAHRLGGEERLEQAGHGRLVHSAARIGHGQHGINPGGDPGVGLESALLRGILVDAALEGRDHHATDVVDGVPCVHAEIGEDLVELGGVDLHRAGVGSRLPDQVDILADEPAQQLQHPGYSVIERQHLGGDGLSARERQQLAREFHGVLGRLADLDQLVRRRASGLEVLQREVGVGQDDAQHVVEIEEHADHVSPVLGVVPQVQGHGAGGQRLILGVPRDGQESVVDLDQGAVGHPGERDRIRRGDEGLLEQLLALALEKLRALALLDVARDAEHLDLACDVDSGTCGDLHPHQGAVLARLLKLHDHRRAPRIGPALQRIPAHPAFHAGRALRRERLLEGLFHGLLDREAPQLANRGADVREAPPCQVVDPDHVADVLADQAVPLLALAQQGLGLPALVGLQVEGDERGERGDQLLLFRLPVPSRAGVLETEQADQAPADPDRRVDEAADAVPAEVFMGYLAGPRVREHVIGVDDLAADVDQRVVREGDALEHGPRTVARGRRLVEILAGDRGEIRAVLPDADPPHAHDRRGHLGDVPQRRLQIAAEEVAAADQARQHPGM